MNNPFIGLIKPQGVVVIGPLSRPEFPAADIWRRIQASQVDAFGLDRSDSRTDNSVISTINQLSGTPELAIVVDDDIKQALVDCEYAGVPLAIVSSAAKLPDRSPDSQSKTRVLHAPEIAWQRPQSGINLIDDEQPLPGNVALISQSTLVGNAMLQHIGQSCSFFVAITPDSEVRTHELIALLLHDESTDVIGIYLEHWHQSRMLLDTISAVSRQKPIVILTPQSSNVSAASDLKLRDELSRRSGAIVVDSLRTFSQITDALSTPTTAKPQRFVSFGPSAASPGHWRHTHALRSLCGVDEKCWIAEVPNDHQSRQAFEQWQEQTPYPVLPLGRPGDHGRASGSTFPPSGGVDALLQAMHAHAEDAPIDSQLSPQAITSIRAALPSDDQSPRLAMPKAAPLLKAAGIEAADGMWVDTVGQLEHTVKQCGWPVSLWGGDMSRPARTRLFNSMEGVRRASRQLLPQGPLWVQSTPRRGIEFSLNASRHHEYGPVMECQLLGVYQHAHQPVHVLLPLSHSYIGEVLQALHLSDKSNCLAGSKQNYTAAHNLISAVNQLFISLPQLQQLKLSPVVLDGGRATVADATIHWNP